MNNKNITFHNATVTCERRNQINNHKSVVIWFTGLSGSGKSTLAHSVEEELHQLSCRTFVLDGDNVRHGLSSDLTFNKDDRRENIRRIGEVSKLMMEAVVITLAAFISPFRKDRNMVRNMLQQGNFIEIYCKASLEVCEARDVKGLYKRARAGEIENYTGINSPYEEPQTPELIINTDKEDLKKSTKKVIDFIYSRKIIC